MTSSNFFRNLTLFLLPALAVFVWLEWRLAHAPNSYALKRQMIEEKAEQTEILVLGNSHAYFDFDPSRFSRPGLNLANTSQSLQLDLQLYAEFAERFKNLRLIVLNLSYFSFEYRLYGNSDDYREFLYTRAFGIEGDGGLRSKFDLRRYSLVAALGPKLIQQILFQGFGENLLAEVTPLGWMNSSMGRYSHAPVSAEVGRSRAQYHTSTLRPELTGETIASITELVRIAKLRGVKVVLSQAPASPFYFDAFDRQALTRFDGNIQQLKQTLDLEFHNYLRDARFKTEDFYDNDHLNSDAAQRFSEIFDREVIHPLLH